MMMMNGRRGPEIPGWRPAGINHASWAEGSSSALVGSPSSDVVTIKMPLIAVA